MTRTPADDEIWRAIRDIQELTNWPPSAIKAEVAERLGVTVERVTDVWIARLAMFGG